MITILMIMITTLIEMIMHKNGKNTHKRIQKHDNSDRSRHPTWQTRHDSQSQGSGRSLDYAIPYDSLTEEEEKEEEWRYQEVSSGKDEIKVEIFGRYSYSYIVSIIIIILIVT